VCQALTNHPKFDYVAEGRLHLIDNALAQVSRQALMMQMLLDLEMALPTLRALASFLE